MTTYEEYRASLTREERGAHCGNKNEHSVHSANTVAEFASLWAVTCPGTPLLFQYHGAPPVDYDAWVARLSKDERRGLCGSRTAHGVHYWYVAFTGETPYQTQCGGVPSFAGTHRERFLALLAEWEITPDNEWTQEPGHIVLVAGTGGMLGWGEHTLQVKFNEDGSFQEMGAW